MASLKITGITETKKALAQFENQLKKQLRAKKKAVTIDIASGIKIDFVIEQKKGFDELAKTLGRKIKNIHKKAMLAVANDLEQALNASMNSAVWDWNGDSRDIVDTGELRDSLSLILDSDSDIHILYNEDYAAIVHYGGYFNPYGNPNVSLYYPGRPWVDSVLFGGGPVPQFDVEERYAIHFSELISKVKV